MVGNREAQILWWETILAIKKGRGIWGGNMKMVFAWFFSVP